MVMVIILTAMDTVVFAAAAFETFTGMPFIEVVFTAVALITAALTAMAPTAVDDSYVYNRFEYLGRKR